MRPIDFEPIRGFLLDMDGTIYLDDELIPGTIEFLNAVQQSGRQILFLTNNSSKSEAQYKKKLERLGIPSAVRHVLTSGKATAKYLQAHFPKARVLTLGNEHLCTELRTHGVDVVEDNPDIALIGFDTSLTYEKLSRFCQAVRLGIPYIATHPDYNCPTKHGFIPDCGSLIAAIHASTNRMPDPIIGKPYEPILHYAIEEIGLRPDEIAIAGDRLYTDIEMGTKQNIRTILVLSGEAKLEDAQQVEHQPTWIVDRLSDIIPML